MQGPQCIRQFFHFLRDNIVWRTADAGRIAFDLLHTWIADRRAEARALAVARPRLPATMGW